jgi:hypothetical protein
VIDDPLAPDPPQFRIGHPRQDDRILDRDRRLVAIAVEGPGPELILAERALVHHQMKWMPVVITLGADGLQPRLEFIG